MLLQDDTRGILPSRIHLSTDPDPQGARQHPHNISEQWMLKGICLVFLVLALDRLPRLLRTLNTSVWFEDFTAMHAAPAENDVRTAVCVVGALRSFYHAPVHESFRNHVLSPLGYDEGLVDVYFDATVDFNCDSNPGWTPQQTRSCQDKEKLLASREAFHAIVNTTLDIVPVHLELDTPLDCDHGDLVTHPCCSPRTRSRAGNSPGSWAGFLAMQRKVRCLKRAMAANRSYDYYLVTRPDLYYFEDAPRFEDLIKRPDRVYFSSKERDQNCYGDYMYLIPHQYAASFAALLGGAFNDTCEARGEMPWPPEYHLDARLSEQQAFPTQMVPWAFAIARVDGTADCGRLDNEVWHRNRAFWCDDRVVSIEELCQLMVKNGTFDMEPRQGKRSKPAL